MPTILGIDWGARRVGVARAHSQLRRAEPLATLPHDDSLFPEIGRLAAENTAECIVIGLPRNLDGEETGQSEQIRAFAREVEQTLQYVVAMQDETLSSHEARRMQRDYPDASLDSCAAATILQDYLNAQNS